MKTLYLSHPFADLVFFFYKKNPFVGFSELNETVPIITNVESESIEEAPTSSSQSENVRRELVMLSLPAFAGQAIDPLAQLMETAYIGRLGKVELLHNSAFLCNSLIEFYNLPRSQMNWYKNLLSGRWGENLCQRLALIHR